MRTSDTELKPVSSHFLSNDCHLELTATLHNESIIKVFLNLD